VGDPYTINPESSDLFDGGIIALIKTPGAQKLIAGAAATRQSRGVAVVQNAGN